VAGAAVAQPSSSSSTLGGSSTGSVLFTYVATVSLSMRKFPVLLDILAPSTITWPLVNTPRGHISGCSSQMATWLNIMNDRWFPMRSLPEHRRSIGYLREARRVR
jgi:hypothetical protein